MTADQAQSALTLPEFLVMFGTAAAVVAALWLHDLHAKRKRSAGRADFDRHAEQALAITDNRPAPRDELQARRATRDH